ncbi:putrescine importer [Mycobacterium frederiksbergense]|uniref:Putrescine importer n=1 Tax=Mycolicibacterium frederiksbergense TaxID=117567 RepID=A0ABT6KSQ6_9MYCO|nr:APC family permease [Mycolicibacterium frederiksbergense]MDH6193761.1 putrescine importer [Mycolicibacterium frederiksbergense]
MKTDATAGPVLNRVLGLPAAVRFGLSYMIPLTVFTTVGIVNTVTEGHIISAYGITLIAMLFTALSYAFMSRAVPRAGSAYAYAKQSFGGNIGFLSGWTLLLDYLLMPTITYLVIGLYMNAAFPGVPFWVWVLGSIAVVTVLTILGITVVSGVSSALLLLQVVFLAVFAFLTVRSINGTPLPPLTDALFGTGPGISHVFAGAAILCLSFLGFDAVSTLAEETVDAKMVIPKAIVLVTLIGGLLFMVIAYLCVIAFPDWQNYTDADAASLDIMARAGGSFLTNFFTAAYVAGCFGAVLASQTSVARILYAMGRDGTLPRHFASLHPRFHTPWLSAILVGTIGLLALVLSLSLVSSLISFGSLVAFTAVNASVIKHYVIDQRRRDPRSLLLYFALPLVGLTLCLWLWTSLSADAFKIGIPWLLAGIAVLAFSTRGFRRTPPSLDQAELVP